MFIPPNCAPRTDELSLTESTLSGDRFDNGTAIKKPVRTQQIVDNFIISLPKFEKRGIALRRHPPETDTYRTSWNTRNFTKTPIAIRISHHNGLAYLRCEQKLNRNELLSSTCELKLDLNRQ